MVQQLTTRERSDRGQYAADAVAVLRGAKLHDACSAEARGEKRRGRAWSRHAAPPPRQSRHRRVRALRAGTYAAGRCWPSSGGGAAAGAQQPGAAVG